MDSEDMRKQIKEVKECSKHFIELAFSLAKLNRAYYEALLEQGFTSEQALRLVEKQTFAMYGGKGGG